jgi:hypothetical protein
MLYYIVAFSSEDGTFKGLHSTTEEDYANAICEDYCEKFPYRYFDVFTEDEYDYALANN